MREQLKPARLIGLLVLGAFLCLALAASKGDAAREKPGTIVASGVLRDSSGTPSSGTVSAYAWPLDGRDGTQELPRIAKAQTDSAGYFELKALRLKTLYRAGDSNGGYAHILIEASGDKGTEGSELVPVDLDEAQTSAPRPVVVKVSHAAASSNADRRRWHCPTAGTVGRKRLHTYRRLVTVGELNNKYDDTAASFTYGRSADSTIQSGVRSSGEAWHINGSTTVRNSGSSSVGETLHRETSHRIRTTFAFPKYRVSWCDYRTGARHQHMVVFASRWLGGFLREPQTGALNRCTKTRSHTYTSGTNFKRNKRSARIWRHGVGIFGLGLNTRSGFSQFVRVRMQFGHHRHHYICGEQQRSPQQSQRIFSGGLR